mgnify:CR=1 FL=1
MVGGGAVVQFKKPDWWDEWVEVDEEKVLKGEDGWSLREGAPTVVRREFEKIIEMIKLARGD